MPYDQDVRPGPKGAHWLGAGVGASACVPVPAEAPAPDPEDVPELGITDWLGVGVGDGGSGDVLLGCAEGD
jgi:hypothetical protein